MQPLSPAGQQIVDDIAKRYGYSSAAVLSMLQAVVDGNAGWRSSTIRNSPAPGNG